MSNSNKIILDRVGVRACGPLRAGVLYDISDAEEAKRLVETKKFRKATAADEKRCTQKLPMSVTYAVVREDKEVEITATGWIEPEKKAAPEPEPETKPVAEKNSAGPAGAQQEDK